MLDGLEDLADDIARLSKACTDLEGTPVVFLIRQLVQHLRSALTELVERDGMLTVPLPWWTEWQGSGCDSSARS